MPKLFQKFRLGKPKPKQRAAPRQVMPQSSGETGAGTSGRAGADELAHVWSVGKNTSILLTSVAAHDMARNEHSAVRPICRDLIAHLLGTSSAFPGEATARPTPPSVGNRLDATVSPLDGEPRTAEVPLVVERACARLLEEGPRTPGIFRKSGSLRRIRVCSPVFITQKAEQKRLFSASLPVVRSRLHKKKPSGTARRVRPR